MTSDLILGSFFNIATLPQPLDADHGRLQASLAHALLDSKIRKRHEVVVAIDGDGIYIHNAQPSRLITSYAFPPQAYFACAPCSVYVRSTRTTPASRFTYAAIRSGTDASQIQLICFHEQGGQSDATLPRRTAALCRSHDAVISLNIIPAFNIAEDRQTHDVVVTHRNGDVECFTEALEKLSWNCSLEDVVRSSHFIDDSATSIQIEHTGIFAADDVKNGVFKHREDILPVLDAYHRSGTKRKSATQVLFLVARNIDRSMSPANSCVAHILAIQTRTSARNAVHTAPVQHLLGIQLPLAEPQELPNSYKPTWSFDPKTGNLHQLHNGSISTYEIANLTPKHINRLYQPMQEIEDFVRLSPSLVLTTSKVQHAIYDINYGSLQASRPLPADIGTATIVEERRKYQDPTHVVTRPRLLGYFSKVGLALALSGSEILGLQIGGLAGSRKRKRKEQTTLLDSIFRGVTAQNETVSKLDDCQLPTTLGQQYTGLEATANSQWNEMRKQLDASFDSRDTQGFQATFSLAVNARTSTEEDTPRLENHGVQPAEVSSERSHCHWNLGSPPASLYHSARYRVQALYALSKIFQWESAESCSLSPERQSKLPSSIRIEFFVPDVFGWLIHTQQLTPSMVWRALCQTTPPVQHRALSPGDLMCAIANHDRSLGLLDQVLSTAPYLPIDEVSKAVQIIIQSLDNSGAPLPKARLITDVEEIKANGCGVDQSYLLETDAVMEELDYATSLLEHGLHIRRQSLRNALTSLYTRFSASHITDSFRKMLSQHELIFLIHILRIELADGGWTARYIDNLSLSPEGDEPDNKGITIIAKLLSCAVNSIGVSGWLVASATDPADALDELLSSLRAEVSAALEGMHEATFVSGFLDEFLGYAWRKEQADAAQPRRLRADIETVKVGDAKKDPKILPLGLKPEQPISRTKVSSGGQVHMKSSREIGLEISMRVPDYSFEKIRF